MNFHVVVGFAMILLLIGMSFNALTLPTAEILSAKNERAWVSM